jgi:hypothetical protein
MGSKSRSYRGRYEARQVRDRKVQCVVCNKSDHTFFAVELDLSILQSDKNPRFYCSWLSHSSKEEEEDQETVMTREDSSNRVPACLKCHNEVSQPPFYEVTEGSKIKGCQEDTADPQLCRAKHVEVEAIQIDVGIGWRIGEAEVYVLLVPESRLAAGASRA